VEFTFTGESAHSAGRPWRGRSALDAAMLMDIGWNFRREHLRPEQRSHSVISDGGDQPNVVPSKASIWYYIREMDYPDIRRNFDIGDRIAEGAALMTDTEMEYRILGTAWPRHFNRPIAEAMQKHIEAVGLPEWSEADQALARAVQKEVGRADTNGLATGSTPCPARPRPPSGGSDDIGDVSWVVPTVTLRFPSNIPGLPGHNWSSAIAMATPIAHKGATAGAKVIARTALEMFLNPAHRRRGLAYFREVQTRRRSTRPSSPRTTRRRSGSTPHHGGVPAEAGAVLLRRDPVRQLPGAAGDRVPDALRHRGLRRAVDAGRQPHEVAPRAHELVLRDVRPEAAPAGYRPLDPRTRSSSTRTTCRRASGTAARSAATSRGRRWRRCSRTGATWTRRWRELLEGADDALLATLEPLVEIGLTTSSSTRS
jgi:hypothetical protein